MAEPSFDGQVVVVTGAARGLGLSTAWAFAGAGAHAVLADIDGAAAAGAARRLQAEGLRASAAGLDVRDPTQSDVLVRDILAERGQIDVWVNSASLWYEGPAELLPQAWWDESLAVMLSGAFYCSQAAGRHMIARRAGVIVNIASVDGLQPVEGHAAYSVAQAGLIMLTQALGVEWAHYGVRVVGVAPGVVGSGWLERADGDTTALAAIYRRRTPLGRLGAPSEVAQAVLYLASSEATYITAETLPVDGGWTAYQLF